MRSVSLPPRAARQGFTLIELLVVIAIIAILAAILFPVFAKAREKARQSSCLNNQRQIAVAILMYAQDHDETLPDSSSVWPEINVDRNILMCPTKGKKVANAYVYNDEVSSLSLGEFTDPTGTMLTADGQHAATAGDSTANPPVLPTYDNCAYTIDDLDARHSNKFVCTYADGHVEVASLFPDKLPVRGALVLWLKADAIDGGSVSVWQDASSKGNNMNIINATTQAAATLNVSTVEIKGSTSDSKTVMSQAVAFDGANCGNNQSFKPNIAESGVTMFGVLSSNASTVAATAYQYILLSAGPNSAPNLATEFNVGFTGDGTAAAITQIRANIYWPNATYATDTVASDAATFHVASCNMNPKIGNVRTYFDGALVENTAAATSTQNVDLVDTAVGINLGGNVTEVIMYTPALGDLSRAWVENYLKTKFAL
jgi:prepilin-type N-terminal cleavage/methylation domain-containing protein/prepilin-type processing-associated H-X9-DG protein